MTIVLENCATPPSKPEWEAMLREYYDFHVARMAEIGFSIGEDTVRKAISEYWEDIAAYLPPRGQTLLARRLDGTLVGCGTLKGLGDDMGELKRLFVRPEARGTGLGRLLVETRIDTSRQMGLKKLVVDALKHSQEMISLYRSLGFREAAPNLDSATAKLDADFVAHTVFFEFDLTEE